MIEYRWNKTFNISASEDKASVADNKYWSYLQMKLNAISGTSIKDNKKVIYYSYLLACNK